MHPVGLPLAARIRQRRLQTIDYEPIVGAGPCLFYVCRPPTSVFSGQGEFFISDFHFQGTGSRSPNLKYVHAMPPGVCNTMIKNKK
jgi:hypothetical protein